jgi:hypothetical protein
MNYRSCLTRFLLTTSLIATAASGVYAAEGGTSHYLAGIQADLGFALPPAPGLTMRDILWSENGQVDAAVLAAQEHRDVDVHTVLDIVAATYAFDAEFLRGSYSVAVLVPFGSTSVKGNRVEADGSLTGVDENTFGLGDIEFIPLQLNWSRGNFYFKLSQSIIAPTGAYDEDSPANIGKGYWSFDTVGTVTYFNPNWGTELSAAWGLMHNADSEYIGYHTSNESHVDFAISQYLTDSFALSIQGYRLNQLKRDRGDDTVLGPLEGFSRGIGAGFSWTPAAANGTIEVSGSYMSDFESRDGRLESDHAQLAVTWVF